MNNSLTIEFEVITVDAQGRICQKENHSNQAYQETLDELSSLLMVAIPAGQFLMGSPETEEGFQRSQGPQHNVTLPSFWMSQTPITQIQWEAVTAMPKVNLSLDPYAANFVGENRPMEQVSWFEAKEFCDRLSRFTHKSYRLPRETEWEYACRGGTQTPFHLGPTLTTDLANYSGIDWEYQGKICNHGSYDQGPKGEDRRQTTEVGAFNGVNAFGLYDLHGNIREWCADAWHRNYFNAPQDGSEWIKGCDESKRVVRGGSWNQGPRKCRSAYRDKADPQARLYDLGFRVVCEPF